MYKIIIIVAILAVLTNCGSGYRILCPYPFNSRSHFIVADALFKGLAAKGHDVTVISAFPPDKPIKNYRHITLELVANNDEIVKPFLKTPGNMTISVNLITTIIRITVDESRSMLKNPNVQKIMVEEKFDLVIIEFLGELHVGLAAHFNCPTILFSSGKPIYRLLELLNNKLELSYVSYPKYPWVDLDRFKDRLYNFEFYIVQQGAGERLLHQYKVFHDEQFPAPKYPSFNDILNNNVAAVFTTNHFSEDNVRSLVPGVIDISGIQMTEHASPLPDALQSWMDKSTNGVIFFSLGSNLKESSFSLNLLQSVINVFKKLKQNVLWKSDMTMILELPANVRLEKWVSQVDVLQHKNIRVFITHGGFESIIESKFYGVPVLTIPKFGDQISNADSVVAEGWGVQLLYSEFTEERLINSINEVLDNRKYFDQAQYESMLFRDRPMTPLQTGIYWVEYIIRHKGARHLRLNARHLNWFQLYSFGFISYLLVAFVCAYITYKIIMYWLKKIIAAIKPKPKPKRNWLSRLINP